MKRIGFLRVEAAAEVEVGSGLGTIEVMPGFRITGFELLVFSWHTTTDLAICSLAPYFQCWASGELSNLVKIVL